MRKEARDEASKIREDAAAEAKRVSDSVDLQAREAKELLETAKATKEQTTTALKKLEEERAKLDAAKLLVDQE